MKCVSANEGTIKTAYIDIVTLLCRYSKKVAILRLLECAEDPKACEDKIHGKNGRYASGETSSCKIACSSLSAA